jgi:hypothetical protein
MNSVLSPNEANDIGAATRPSRLRLVINISAALVFASLMMMVPWEALQGSPFADRSVYIDYFLYQESVLDYREFLTVLDYVTHEWLWHFLISFLVHDLSISLDIVFGFISFLCLSSFAFFLASRQTPLAIPLLVNPLLVVLAFSQLRIALAFSLLLLAYMSGRKTALVLAVAVSGLIHTAVFLIVAMAVAVWWVRKYILDRGLNHNLAFLALCVIGFAVAVVLGPALQDLLAAIGDRRAAVYTDGRHASGVKFTLFWAGALMIAALQGKEFLQKSENLFAVVILSFTTFSILTGAYATRLLSIALPMILSAIIDFRRPFNHATILLYVLYIFLYYVFFFSLDLF